MSNTATKQSNKVTALFNKNEGARFLTPLIDFLRISGDKITIRFNKNNTITIKAINDSKNIISYIEYLASGLPSLKVTEDCRAPIYELSEFVSSSKIFSNGFEFKFDDSDKSLELISGDEDLNQAFKYYISDEAVINTPPESLKSVAWVTEFPWDTTKYSAFVRGMSSIKHPYIIFEGKKGEKSVSVTVTENKMKTTSLKTVVKIEKENIDNFRIVLNKENFLNPITSSIETFTVSLSPRITKLTGASEYHNATYYITSVVETGE